MLIDSGASTNVINKKLYLYGSKQPLEVLGTFLVLTKVGETAVKAEFGEEKEHYC